MTANSPRRSAPLLRRWGVSVACAAACTAAMILPQPDARADDFTVGGQMAMTGLAADLNRGWYWGTTARTASEVVALDRTGKVVAKLTLARGVVDVQALSYHNGALYIGDIGDAQRSRESVQVLRVRNPGSGQRQASVYTLTYPDGPRDAAALMVSPKGNIYLVTRGDNPGIYRPQWMPSNGSTVPLRRVADAPAGVTDGTFLADGARMALRSPLGIHVIDAYSFDAIALGQVPGQVEGDALTTSLDQRTLVAGQGGTKPSAVGLPIPTGFTSPTPKPTSASPTASAPASKPAASASAVSTKAPSMFSGENRKTILAVGGAAGLAVVAGLSTLVGRREDGDAADDPAGDAEA